MGARLRVQGPQAGQRRVEAVRACLPWAFSLIMGCAMVEGVGARHRSCGLVSVTSSRFAYKGCKYQEETKR